MRTGFPTSGLRVGSEGATTAQHLASGRQSGLGPEGEQPPRAAQRQT